MLAGRFGTTGLAETCGFSLGAGLGGTGLPASLLIRLRSLSLSPTIYAGFGVKISVRVRTI